MTANKEATVVAKMIENWRTIGSVFFFVALFSFYGATAFSDTVSKGDLKEQRILLQEEMDELEMEFQRKFIKMDKADEDQKKAIHEIKVEIARVQTTLEQVVEMLRNR